jgi:flagellar protein FlaG
MERISPLTAEPDVVLKPVETARTVISKNASVAENEKKELISEEKTTEKKIDETDAQKIADKVNEHVKLFQTRLQFAYDAEKDKAKITVLDKESGKVIRQIPPEEMLSLIDKMEKIAGLIFNQEA